MKKALVYIVLLVAWLAPSLVSAQVGTALRASNRTASSQQSPTYNPYNNTDNPDSLQNATPEGIIYDNGEEADSVLRMKVFMFPSSKHEVKIRSIQHPSLDPTGTQMHNPTHRLDGDYKIDLGALGQTAMSLFPKATPFSRSYNTNRGNGIPSPLPGHHTYKYFQTQTPYTLLGYGSSLNKDYQIQIIHSQNIKQRWNMAFLYDLTSRDGQYTNSSVTSHIIDLTTNYYSRDARYQLQAGMSLNRHRQGENGGVQNDTTCWSYNRPIGVPINMYAAQNQWRNFSIDLHQSFNTVRQLAHHRPIVKTFYDTVHTLPAVDSTAHSDTGSTPTIIQYDSIVGYDTLMPHEPHILNTGVLAMDFELARMRRIFADNQADSRFYDPSLLDTTFYYDSTQLWHLATDIYWTNDAYMHHRWANPLVLQVGVRPQYDRLQFAMPGRHINEFNLTAFASADLHIKRMLLHAKAEEASGGRRNGDYHIEGILSVPAGQCSRFRLHASSEAQSPDLLFYHNEGHYSWDVDSYDKIKRQHLNINYDMHRPDSLKGHLRTVETNTSATLLSNNVWFADNMQPVQGDATGLLLQGKFMVHLQFGWFSIRLQEMLQHSSNDDVIRVPLFASKNSLYADATIFGGALHIQTGFDIRYHTRFKADGWNPVLGAFYRQDEQEIGNYLVADFWINLQVKRASIYLKASHFNAPLEELMKLTPSYFSLPHYPLEDFGLYWGITWKFFN